jgi:hypothetical protein
MRRAIRWTGLSIVVLSGAAWIVSQWMYACFVAHRWRAGIEFGHLKVTCLSPVIAFGEDPGLYWGRLRTGPHPLWLWLEWKKHALDVPLWAPIAIVLGIVAVRWLRIAIAHWRAPPGHCRKCRYDRSGLASGTVCPECGTAPRT